MSNKLNFRLANPADFAGSPLLENDDDEETAPVGIASQSCDEVTDVPTPSLRRLLKDVPREVAVGAGKPSQTVSTPRPAPTASYIDSGAMNPFVDAEESFRNDDDDGGEQGAAARPTNNARRKKRRQDSRFTLSPEHESILEWTDKARYTSKDQVAVLLEIAPRKAVRLLDRLVEQDFMDKKVQAGAASGYYLTDVGKDFVGSETRTVNEKSGRGLLLHTLEVGWLMLMIVKDVGPVAQWAEQKLGRKVELDDFVSEAELIRAVNLAISRLKSEAEEKTFRTSGFRKQALWWEGWSDLRNEARDRARHGEAKTIRRLTDLAAWNLESDSSFRKPHYPDLILRAGDQALAFEIERSRKPASTEDIVRSYGRPADSAYERVLWSCAKPSVVQAVKQSVEAYSLDPFIRHHGQTAADGRRQLEEQVAELRRSVEAFGQSKARDDAIQLRHHQRRMAELARREGELHKAEEPIATATKADAAESNKVLAFHSVSLFTASEAFRADFLAKLNAVEAAAQVANRHAREAQPWHVNGSGRAVPCRCGVTCMAAHGQFPTEQDARDFAEEVA